MNSLYKIRKANAELASTIFNRGCCILSSEVDEIESIDRATKVLVRTNLGRFTCQIQYLNHFLGIIEREGSDYLRDVSILVD